MKIITRYLATTTINSIATVMLAVAGFEIFILLISELGDIGHGHYGIGAALLYVLLNLPGQLYDLFPMVGLLGMLMGLGLLANNSELTILRAAGLSPLNIGTYVLQTLLLLIIVATVFGEVIAPFTSHYAEKYKERLVHSSATPDAYAYDVWVKSHQDYLHIANISQDKIFHGITWYHFEDGKLVKVSLAKTGTYQNDAWHVQNIQSTLFFADHTTNMRIAETIWPFALAPEILHTSTEKTSNLSLAQLNESLAFHKASSTESRPLQLAFWKRFLQPFASLVMMLLAIPFIFGPLRNANYSLRLVAGIGIGFAFYYCNQLVGPISLILQWPPLLGAAFPIIFFGTAGFIMLKLEKG